MKKYINIDDRMSSQLEEYCSINKLKINDYINEAISNKLYTDIYGDLNLKFKDTVEEIEDKETKVIEEKVNIWDDIDEIILNKQEKIVIILDKEDNKHLYDINKFKIIEEKKEVEEIDKGTIVEDRIIKTKRQLKTK